MGKDTGLKVFFSDNARYADVVNGIGFQEYASADELVKVKDYYKKDGRIDMCRGLTELIAQGKENGKSEGRIEGRTEGRMEGIRALIETCQDFGISKKDVLLKIAEKFSLSDGDAEKYINEYWK